MSYIRTPNFPIITWSIDLDGTDEITVTVSGGVGSFSAFIPAGTYWGYSASTDPAEDAGPDSLASVVASTIQDIMTDAAKFNQATATCTASYTHNASGTEVLTKYTRFNFYPLATSVTVTISATTNLSIEMLGFSTGIVWTALGGANDTSDYNSTNYWAPGNITVYDDRNQTASTFVTESIFSNTISAIRWGSPKTRRLLVVPTVYAAMLYLYRRVDSGFADPATVDIADPNNLLENLWYAASTGAVFRIYQDPVSYRTAYMSEQRLINDMNENVEDISGRGAIFEVTLSFLDLGTTTGAI